MKWSDLADLLGKPEAAAVEVDPPTSTGDTDDRKQSGDSAKQPFRKAASSSVLIRVRISRQAKDNDIVTDREQSVAQERSDSLGAPCVPPAGAASPLCKDGVIDSGAGAGEPLKKKPIAGVNDRAHHLAMVHITVTPQLPQSLIQTASGLPPLRPKSRADCQRRCGSDGFCDPSSELGCGGEYCGWKYGNF